jgi:hypothetical protein
MKLTLKTTKGRKRIAVLALLALVASFVPAMVAWGHFAVLPWMALAFITLPFIYN